MSQKIVFFKFKFPITGDLFTNIYIVDIVLGIKLCKENMISLVNERSPGAVVSRKEERY